MRKTIATVAAVLGLAAVAGACTPQDQLLWFRSRGLPAEVTASVGEAVPDGMRPGEKLNLNLPYDNNGWDGVQSCKNLLGTPIELESHVFCRDVYVPTAQSWMAQFAVATPAPAPAPANSQAVARWSIVDGDTIDTEHGRIRILGYDTPERGECGYDTASSHLNHLLSQGAVTLSADNGDNTDRYGRLLRHVLVNGNPVGLSMIQVGYANARYDSLDGYPRHRYQDQYRAADGPNTFNCSTGGTTAPVAPPPPVGAEPWNQPVSASNPDLDCSDIGRKVWVGSNDYHRLDRDGDGWGCDSYG